LGVVEVCGICIPCIFISIFSGEGDGDVTGDDVVAGDVVVVVGIFMPGIFASDGSGDAFGSGDGEGAGVGPDISMPSMSFALSCLDFCCVVGCFRFAAAGPGFGFDFGLLIPGMLLMSC
jgi:hypothetical protein